MTTILLGILSSIGTDLINWLNRKFKGTVLEGNGAFILSLLVAVIASTVKLYYIDGTVISWDNKEAVVGQFGAIWATSQIYFQVISKTLGIQVSK